MKNQAHRTVTSLPLLLVLALSAGPAAGQESHLVAETYGRASGDTPSPELGLVLELVDAGTPHAHLSLFGGIPGQAATIVVSRSKSESAPSANGAITLVGPTLFSSSGTFDWHGIYEFPLNGIAPAAGQALYAQGIHTGLLDFGGAGALQQFSHGLELRVAAQDDEPLWFDDLLPHLPDARDLAGTQGLSDKLQRMLNSAGDSVRVALEIEITAGLGIEVVETHAGGKLGLEFTVERTPEGHYKVEVAADLAALAGAGAGTGAEVQADASAGYGATRIFRFDSAPGAARGIFGIVLALRFPELQPAHLLENTGILGAAGERVRELQALVQFAADHVDELEAFLWQVLDQRVAVATSARASAAANLATANRNYANAPWYLRPVYWAQVLACRAALAAADARLAVVRTAREQGAIAVDAAEALLAAKRAELADALREVARLGRLAASIAQLRGWATDHYAGSEVRYRTALEVEAQVKAPVVDLKNLGVGASGEVQQEFVTRWEPASGDRPARVTVLQSLELTGTVSAGNVIFLPLLGGEMERKRTIEIADTFDVGTGASTFTGRKVSFTNDVSLVGADGLIVVQETGVGRTRTVSLSDGFAGDLASLSSLDTLLQRVGSVEVGFELQDRRQKNVDAAAAVDVSGTGGGFEFELEWADQGRLLSRSTTVAEGLETILNGASQVIDVATGSVIEVEP